MSRLQAALGTDMRTLAKALQAKGRGKDSVLAHITAEEARLLKQRGGRGSRNPATGLLEFDDTLPPETVTVSAPSPSVSAPAISAPVSLPPETVTVTGQKQQPATITATPDLNLAPAQAAPLAAPAAAPVAPARATVPAAQAPETVTVQGAAPQPISTATPVEAPQPSGPGLGQRTKDWVSNNSTLLSVLGVGGLGALGAVNSARASKQGQQLQTNLANLAAPLTAAGNQELNATLQGGLTPQRMQALQAVQAQLGQAQAAGAVSAQQVAQSISGTFANLLTDQLNEALGLLNSADSYLQNAYIQGYNANVANQTNTTNFYTNLAQLGARLAGVGGGTTITIPGGTSGGS
jgi:hypothetical protein